MREYCSGFYSVGRGAVRKAVGGDCPEGCTVWLIHSTFKNEWYTPLTELAAVFPGATIERWEPLGVALRGGNLKSGARPKLFAKLLSSGGREFWAKELVDDGEGLKYQTVAKALAHVVEGNPKQLALVRALAAQGLRLRSKMASTGKAPAALYWVEDVPQRSSTDH